ncbi:alkaline phosphatase D family protein [Streptomonospora nanhaiensis]|uniref:Alkaline phosphatase D n=1 Tax=Streptomonospora nanhaiensis TaxID=1323731 RepID=A0A853BU31_9ACTN|nr:alkaline phosphatase D family protein [Streptomonospora nanhaiensis]MBX9389389.1 alkaline phosphatase D family protein [Streptomonospora nanhaiensis]NYI97772.1 alkaline phosphatase D [Streptomonospora nanhaiensis]
MPAVPPPVPATPPGRLPRPARRSVLRYGAAGLGAAALAGLPGAPALAQGRNRPELTHGIQLGDPRPDGAVVWTRADRPSRMVVEVSHRPDFKDSRVVRGPHLLPDNDGTGRVRITGLRPGRRTYVRVRAESDRAESRVVEGSFRTAGGGGAIRFTWSGDVAGQGWGVNPDLGGMPIFAAMADREPDFFLHSGDTCYADGPLQESVTLPDGRVWRNLVTEAKSKVAETLAEFRGQYAYNLLDDTLREFSARVPQIVQWDDHEVTNNWYPGEVLADDRYTVREVDVLARRAHRAFHEWQPIVPSEAVDGRIYRRISYGPDLDVFVIDMRPYRDPNSPGTARYEDILGRRQADWLVRELTRSTATWKVVASDMPIGLIVPDGDAIEAVANGEPGRPRGRESEIERVLHRLHRAGVRDVVWLTADVHYTAAHHYSPERASAKEFTPFWEFVSGPLHAGAFGPSELDPTFGPEAVFVHAPPRANTSPMEGYQHFGEVEIDRESKEFTVTLRDANGDGLWSTTLTPERGR